ncbi:unnamed protein product (macronuclear) [Paramecium tetraurelia]|uniref:TRAF-type domain-containing protein n=1 Tax=Paramecium tetraurelia TaxID=5888 RepID=A0DLH8_PARTE|nr:uncharacterized protein GSPATT00018212001 [Paramecium tetraurelia]CAK83895.1 unnamed protein product [Paramecium tetraurelia]|eukprot:XP_001451292.1 hypothetical protein (macronuclear) [Paramecium tetraurelia strain d4-2]
MSETKLCEGWQAIDLQLSLEEVLTSNYLLHSLYCERNITKCNICDQRMDINEQDVHMDSHQKTECLYCSQMFEKRLLEMHQNNCPNKPEKCGFCDLMINLAEMPRHQANCGSRTEQCQICKKHIQKRGKLLVHALEFNLHISVCGIDQQPPSKLNRLKRITSEPTSEQSSDDASVKEIKQVPRRKPQKQTKPKSKQKEEISKQFNDDEDEDFQKALQLSLNQK